MDSNRNEDSPGTPLTISIAEIHKEAEHWSLEGDSKLLELMQNMSKNLEFRCESTKSMIDKMMIDLNRTSLRLENTSNKMLSLKNIQFMEARVHDETENNINTANKTNNNNITMSTASDRLDEPSTNEAMQTALGNGLRMLDECYEEVILKLDDDSDDDIDDIVHQSTIFRAQNPHDDRPLPHLIGSKEWIQKWHVGLVDSDDDQSIDDKSAPDDLSCTSSSNDDTISRSVSLPSNAHTASDSEYLISQPSQSAAIIQARIESKYFQHDIPTPFLAEHTSYQARRSKQANLFSESDEDGQDQQFDKSEVQSKLENTNNNPVEVNLPASIFRNQSTKTVPSMGWMADEPPDLYTPVPSKRKPINLFVDTDDEDDMFSVPTQQSTTSNVQIIPTAQQIVQNTHKESTPIYEVNNRNPTTQQIPASAKSKILNLFDDSPPDDMFEEIIAKTHSVPTKSRVSIFDDDNNKLFKKDLHSLIAKRAAQLDQSKHNISDVTDRSQETSNKISPTADEYRAPNPHPITNIVANKPQSTNIFNDSDDEDNFLDKIPTNKPELPINQVLTTKVPCEIHKKTNIFDNLFGDDEPPNDNFDDIFGTMPSLVNNQTPIDKSPEIDDIAPNKKKNKDLTNDLTTNTSNILNTHKKSLSNVFDDDVGLVPEPKSMFEPSKVDLSKRNKSKGLFGDSSDDDDSDWFSSINKNKSKDLVDNDLFESSRSKRQNILEDSPSEPFAAEKQLEDPEIYNNSIVVNNKSTSPVVAQFANFFEKNEDSSDAKLVENRRLFVSYLDNEEPPQTENEHIDIIAEKPRNCTEDGSVNKEKENDPPADVNATIIEESAKPVESGSIIFETIQTSFEPKIVAEQSTYLLIADSNIDKSIEEETTDTLSKTIISTHIVESNILSSSDPPPFDSQPQKTLTQRSTFFDDLPPDDDFSATLFRPKTTQMGQSVSLFDDLPPEDDFLPTAIAKPTSSRSTRIFDDHPPDDDEFHFPTQVVKPSSISAETLFDDLPPDDDMFDGVVTAKKSIESTKQSFATGVVRTTEKALFYEDFADTVITKPDSVDLTQSNALIDEVDKVQNFKKKLSKFTNPNHELPKSIPDRPSPRKLNEKLNINLAALLPGARRPSISRTDASSTEESAKEAPEQINEIISHSLPKSTKTEEDSSRLVGLNKGRAKILVKRKPSTRQGRQAEYRKSLLVQDMSEPEDGRQTPNPTKPSLSIADMLANTPAQKSAVLPAPQSTYKPDWLIAPDTSSTFRKMTPKPKPEPSSSSALIKKSAPLRESSSLFSEDDDDDDLFASAMSYPKPPAIAPIKTVPIVSLPQTKNVVVNADSKPPPPPPPMKSNLFDDDDSDDDLFADKKKTIDSQKKPTTKSIPSKSNLFGDTDDEDDDLFGSSSKHFARSTVKLSVQTVQKPSHTAIDQDDPLTDLLK